MKTDLEKRIRVLEDMEEIRKLKHRYCYLVDRGVAGEGAAIDELMQYFTTDAKVDFGELGGVHEGKDAVDAFFRTFVPAVLSYSAHMVANPVIGVNGDHATGRWYVDVPCTARQPEGDTAAWLQARYEESYIREEGIWKWTFMKAMFDFITPFELGWVKSRFPGA